MCSGCGYPQLAGHWTDVADTSPHSRMATRMAMARLISSLLRPHRIGVKSSLTSPDFQLSSATGKRAICRNVDEVWATVSAWTGDAYDPLADVPESVIPA